MKAILYYSLFKNSKEAIKAWCSNIRHTWRIIQHKDQTEQNVHIPSSTKPHIPGWNEAKQENDGLIKLLATYINWYCQP